MKKIITLLLSGLILSTSFAQKKNDKEEVPPELGKASEVLLVRDAETRQVSKCLEESLEKYYKGNYEIVEKEDGSRFKDKEKYRYVMMIMTNFKPGRTIGRDRFPPTTDYKYGVLDRQTGRIYQLDYWARGI